MKVEQNISRLKYLLALYKMSADQLPTLISEGLKVPLTKNDILSPQISVGHLKRIDKIFNKGLHFYLGPKLLKAVQKQVYFLERQSLEPN